MSTVQGARQRNYALLATLATLIVILLLVLLAEGGIRLRQWLKHGQTGTVNSLLVEDKATGLTVPRPGSHNGGRILINSLGFRSPELDPNKPDLRLAFLGASTTFCAEVSSNEATWPHLVTEQVRRGLPDKRVDYINAGVPGYVVATSHENWRRRVARHRPDIVVIYHATNDLAKDSRVLAQAQGLVAQPKEAEQSWLARHSMLWFLVEKNLAIRAAKQHVATADAPRLERLPAEIADGFRQRLRALVREVQATGAQVVLPTFSYRLRREQSPQEQLKAAESALYYMPYMGIEALLKGYEAYNAAIRRVAQDTGALLIEGELNIPGDAAHFTDSVHFTDQGSAAMARRVAAALTAPEVIGRLKRHKGWS